MPAPRPSPATLERLVSPATTDVDRAALAVDLAVEGYTIDVPIDVWGLEPVETTARRRMYGYTWVPPALAPNVEVAPGLLFPGRMYDSRNPPLGSILVPLADGSYVTGPSPLPPVPIELPKPPAAPMAVFGIRQEDGSWTIGAGDTMPNRSVVAGPDGKKYLKETRGFWTRYFPAE